MTARLALVAATGLMTIAVEARSPEAATIAAWDAFVARAEREAHSCRCDMLRPEGRTFEVPGGMIHQWRGSVFIRGVTLDDAVRALMSRGIPPPQDEVLESRVLSRSGDSLVVYLKMSRRTLVTVTYEQEADGVRVEAQSLSLSRG
jgi:hypothetical protein